MDPTSGHSLAEHLRNLRDGLTQGASAISYDPSLLKMKALEGDICVALAMLRRHINPLQSPIYRLPPGLFPEVASHLSDKADLVNATHVSYHLRNMLLSCPTLWSHLDFKHKTMAHAFFERSRQAPLHVNMVRDTARTVGSLAGLRHQSRRITTLKLRHWSIQKKFLSEPLPSLRRLEIFFEHYDDDWDEEWDITWAPIWGPTKKATWWSFPSLTSLIIYGLKPTSFYAPNLTHFKFWDRDCFTDVGELIIFLSKCPLLEHIDISYVRMYGLWIKHDLVVSLPNLRTYMQTDSDEACSFAVLNMLSLPPFCSVTLRSQGDGNPTATTDRAFLAFKNSEYLTEIKRAKLRTTRSTGGGEVAETLELVNVEGTMVCSEVIAAAIEGESNHTPNVAHLEFLRHLDGRSVEVLCIEGCMSHGAGGGVVEFLEEALGFGNLGTLILSRSVVGVCLSALSEDAGGTDNGRLLLGIHTLIIHPSPERGGSSNEVPQLLLDIARKRKAVGFPFVSVSLFLRGGPRWNWEGVLDKLKGCVEKLEVVVGDDALDWNVDGCFLDGLEHLQRNRKVQWD